MVHFNCTRFVGFHIYHMQQDMTHILHIGEVGSTPYLVKLLHPVIPPSLGLINWFEHLRIYLVDPDSELLITHLQGFPSLTSKFRTV